MTLAAWEFYEKNKASLTWDLVVLNPPCVFGVRNSLLLYSYIVNSLYTIQPILHSVPSPNALNPMSLDWYNVAISRTLSPIRAAPVLEYIDVRDLAIAHERALEMPEAGGERIIVSAGKLVKRLLLHD